MEGLPMVKSKSTRRRICGGAAALFAVASLPGCGSQGRHAFTLAPNTLRIGTYFVNPPFEYVANGRRVGFEVDLMNDIARRLSLDAVFIDTQWETILQEMESGLYDCIVGGITITPKRAETLLWSVPYMTTTLSLVIDSIKSPHLQSFADFNRATVGVQAATTDYDIATALLARGEIGGIKVYAFANIGDVMLDLAAGRIDSVMKVNPVAAWLARQTPGFKSAAQVPNDPQPLGIGVRMGNAALLRKIDDALAALKRDGTYDRLAASWGVR